MIKFYDITKKQEVAKIAQALESETAIIKYADHDIFHIAIDGPVASGKGTVAKGLSKKLGIPCLDTGAMYRAFAVYVNDLKLPQIDETTITEALQGFKLDVQASEKTFVTVNGTDVTHKIRDNQISQMASLVSTFPAVRTFMVAKQQEIAREQSFILEGRDIASVVLPNARFKFYLTADLKTRARRRHIELQCRGVDITLKQVEQEVSQRDQQDMNKPVGALKCVAGAVTIDNTKMDIAQTIDAFMRVISGEKK